MKRVVNTTQMSGSDAAIIKEGVPSLVLMERAALAVVDEIKSCDVDMSSTIVLCGSGNNGGDGVAVARILAEDGFSPEIMLFGNPNNRSAQLEAQLKIASHYGVSVVSEFVPGKYNLIIDAIFGIGLSRDITGAIKDVIETANRENAFRVAVDISSGICGNNGQVLGCAFAADLTVTFAAAKIGHLIYPGKMYTGRLSVRKIGIPILSAVPSESVFSIENSDLDILKRRDETGNKSTFGKLLVIAGSDTICGAAYLSAAAALKSGIGMTLVFSHKNNRISLNTLLPETLVSCYDKESYNVEKLKKAVDWADGVLIGPGFGMGELSTTILADLLSINTKPLVMDADALNLMANDSSLWNTLKCSTVLTPHIGEMSRLTRTEASVLKADPVNAARRFAMSHNVTCVMKDAVTVTAEADGTVYINTTGCSALSTAGSGDVLSGIVGAYMVLLRGSEFPFASMAVYEHGKLGEAAAKRRSEASVTAGDLIDELRYVL